MGRAKGLDFKFFHEQFIEKGANGGTPSSTMDLFVILTLEEEVCILGKTPGVCLFVVWKWSYVREVDPVVIFCLTMLMDGSIGTEVRGP